MKRAKIGLIQVDMHFGGDIHKKWEYMTELAGRCIEDGADLVFFPEAYQYTQDRGIIYRTSEMLETAKEWKEKCITLAKNNGVYIVPWDYEIKDGKIFNASYIIDRSGNEIGRYRKVHLTHSEIESGITNGREMPVFDLDFGKVGIMICFDNYFPETARILGNQGAILVLYPLYGDTLIPQWELKMRARAVDNSMYIASCQIGGLLDTAYTGLVNPNGEVICRLDSFGSHRVAEIEPDRRVITHTTGSKEYAEDIRSYLERCRQPAAYSPLLRESEHVQSWNEIFLGNAPKINKK
ncbi:MAG: carbon-nitrogen hydrolase family protein [Eubacteriales bacterium]